MARFLPVPGARNRLRVPAIATSTPRASPPGRRLRGHRGFSAPKAFRTQIHQVAQSHRPTLHVVATIRYVNCVRPVGACAGRGGGTQSRDRARPSPPLPCRGVWGCSENYIIPAPGPELLTPIRALSARIKSNCHHTEPVLRKLKVAMLYGTTWPEARGERLPGSYLPRTRV